MTHGTRCEACSKQHSSSRYSQYDSRRESSSKRGYDRAWYTFLDGFRRGVDLPDDDPAFAATVLERNRCKRCGARHGLEYDHRVPLAHGGARLDPSNIDPLCYRCHRIKTAEDQRRWG